jgi:hypothetical protein
MALVRICLAIAKQYVELAAQNLLILHKTLTKKD